MTRGVPVAALTRLPKDAMLVDDGKSIHHLAGAPAWGQVERDRLVVGRNEG